jgi:hypothetical protein
MDSSAAVDRRQFVRKSAFAAGAVTLGGLINAGHAGPVTTFATTAGPGTTTVGMVQTLVKQSNTYYGSYTFPGLTGNTADQIIELNWNAFYDESGAEQPAGNEAGPESNWVACSLFEDLKIEGNPPTVTNNPDGSATLTMAGTTVTIWRRIKRHISEVE